MGLHVVDLQEALTELVIQIGMMGVLVASQPNERGESLWVDWWHWVAIGLSGVVVLVVAIALL
jgi:hypothetical protein